MPICGLPCREATLAVEVERSDGEACVFVNDVEREEPFVLAEAAGPQHVRIGLPTPGDGSDLA